MKNITDMALDALLTVSREAVPLLDSNLLTTVYQIEKSYQFEQDRDLPLKALQNLLDNKISLSSWSDQ
jgi:hypothetical protein